MEAVRGPGSPGDAAVTAGGRVVVARIVRRDVVVTGAGRRLTVPGGGYGQLSPDGRWVTAATDAGVDIWSVDEGRRATSIEGVSSLAFSPDGSVLATVTRQVGSGGLQRSAVELWDVRSRHRLGEEPLVDRAARFDGARLAFAPDASRLVVSGLGTPVIFDLDVDEWAARAARLAAGAP